ncbi:MAG: tRNA (adenosine(37)-N6)-dimethylallyltransferase MiaA [Pseudomonadota bacterium]
MNEAPILIAGPTASGKSALGLALAEHLGGQIINADSLQVYDCWRVLTARPGPDETARVPHALYGHVSRDTTYSVGHWLRDVAPLLAPGQPRAIILGGTGLYFTVLTHGLADIPPIPPAVRARADRLSTETLRSALDPVTAGRIDMANRARVQRAWEVAEITGRGLAHWHDATPPPLLPRAHRFVIGAPPEWLTPRIEQRLQKMVGDGALAEVAAFVSASPGGRLDGQGPAAQAIGAQELAAHLAGETTLDEALTHAALKTRRYAKRQRTWFRQKLSEWRTIPPQIEISEILKIVICNP